MILSFFGKIVLKIPVIGWAISFFSNSSEMGNNNSMIQATDRAADAYETSLKELADTQKNFYWAIVVGTL